ncbi:MAG: helix-turn-helix domain-containing protein [Bacteroidales bacterium]
MIRNRFNILRITKALEENRPKISLRDIHYATGISEKTLSAWANGSVKRYDDVILDALCCYFNCDVGDLLVFDKRGSDEVDGEENVDPKPKRRINTTSHQE